MHVESLGVAKDEAEAMKWFRKAADQDDAVAQWMHHAFASEMGVDPAVLKFGDSGFDFMLKTASGTWHAPAPRRPVQSGRP